MTVDANIWEEVQEKFEALSNDKVVAKTENSCQ